MIGEYEVTQDIDVPVGEALANPKQDNGGGSQFFIQDYANNLEINRSIPLGN